MTPSITLVLPGYNEQDNIGETTARCLRELGRFTEHPEIVIVDDGSTDATGALADAIAAREPCVRVLHNPINLGVGISLLVGLAAATGDVVVHDSMDFPFDPADLDKVLPLFPEHDVVAVVRTDRSAHSPYRKLTSWVHHKLVRLLFGTRLCDMNFVQAYKRSVLPGIKPRAKSPAFVTPEMLIRAQDSGLRVAEVRAPFHPRHKGTPSYGKPRDILWTLADMVAFWLERRAARRGASG